ncbi:unnamed protein product [Acanthoscelides obtectus]|uniref:Uncharacterized protein n=1 Tax=Acanthoscelides obtectus TaxID=200917 RepID=A0A9P0LST0_ACAOB|nr:unnamed protein product [Acanthoscelides obtectus]CAK1630307.1 Zinc finger BED domain-containing protein 4 [Acanthoscelides obtectus]
MTVKHMFKLQTTVGFKRLFSVLGRKYSIPSRPYFSKTVIPEIYEKCQSRVAEMIADARFISFTTDMWTSDVNNKSFITLTGHWISRNFEQKHYVLSIRGLDGSHTEAGMIFEEKRSRLTAENGEMLTYLHHNLPLLNFKYIRTK